MIGVPFQKLKATAVLVGLAVALSACQTTGNANVYKSAFEHGQAEPVETAAANDDQATDLGKYQLMDLAPGERPDISSDEAGIWLQMDRAEQSMATSGNRVTDPELNAYVNDIVCRVAGEYCADFRVYVMRIPTFNATMAPNGTMTIYTGLLLRARNEAQLAAVIGHEISHYLRRHSIQRVRDMINKSGTLMFVRMATALAGVGGVGDLVALGTMGSMQAFSRDNEREADGYGLALMVRAGYDPQEAPLIWSRVMRERDANPDAPGYDAFAASHPPSEERNTALTQLAEGVNSADELRTGETAYQKAIYDLRMDFFRDELAMRQYEPLLTLLDILEEDGHRISEIQFMRGELYRLRNAEGDQELALSAYRKAIAEDNVPSEVYRSQGLLLNRAGQRELARASLQTYLDLTPDAPDFKMIQAMLQGDI